MAILLELAESYPGKATLLTDISSKHKIPFEELEEAETKLEQAGLIIIQRNMKKWLYLSEAPSQIRILNVIELFSKTFDGIFVDPKSGKTIPQSNMLSFISEKQAEVEENMRRYWYKVTLDKLFQTKKNQYL